MKHTYIIMQAVKKTSKKSGKTKTTRMPIAYGRVDAQTVGEAYAAAYAAVTAADYSEHEHAAALETAQKLFHQKREAQAIREAAQAAEREAAAAVVRVHIAAADFETAYTAADVEAQTKAAEKAQARFEKAQAQAAEREAAAAEQAEKAAAAAAEYNEAQAAGSEAAEADAKRIAAERAAANYAKALKRVYTARKTAEQAQAQAEAAQAAADFAQTQAAADMVERAAAALETAKRERYSEALFAEAAARNVIAEAEAEAEAAKAKAKADEETLAAGGEVVTYYLRVYPAETADGKICEGGAMLCALYTAAANARNALLNGVNFETFRSILRDLDNVKAQAKQAVAEAAAQAAAEKADAEAQAQAEAEAAAQSIVHALSACSQDANDYFGNAMLGVLEAIEAGAADAQAAAHAHVNRMRRDERAAAACISIEYLREGGGDLVKLSAYIADIVGGGAKYSPHEIAGEDGARLRRLNAALREGFTALSPVQKTICKLLIRGLSLEEIAEATGRKKGTIENHVKAIRLKIAAAEGMGEFARIIEDAVQIAEERRAENAEYARLFRERIKAKAAAGDEAAAAKKAAERAKAAERKRRQRERQKAEAAQA